MAKKLKVALIRNAKDYDFGGAERFPVFLGEILQDNGFCPVVITRHPRLLTFAASRSIKTIKSWWWSTQDWSGPKALLFPVYLIWQFILFFWYIQLFIKIKADIIHIQSKDDFIAATWAGAILGKKVIWTDHADLKHIWKNNSVWYKNPVGKLVRWSARFANTITVVSNSELVLISESLKKNDQIFKKIRIIHNGVADVSVEYSTKSDKSFKYCVVSRLVTDKGIGEAIKAFNNLTSKYPNDQLFIVGDGPDTKKFNNLARNNPNIRLLGYQKDPLLYMATCDIFVHPAYHEGFGISIIEASMIGKPIIATAVGGIVEIITNNKTGLLVKEKSVSELQNAMELLRNNKTLRNNLAKNARTQYLNKFQFNQIVKDHFIPIYKGEPNENSHRD